MDREDTQTVFPNCPQQKSVTITEPVCAMNQREAWLLDETGPRV